MKTLSVIIIAIFCVGFIGVGAFILKILFFPVHTASNLVNVAYDANDKVLNADNAIYNYEWFKQKKADIDAAKEQLSNASTNLSNFTLGLGDRSTWGFEDKQEYGRLNSVVLGIQNYLSSSIGDYNSAASPSYPA